MYELTINDKVYQFNFGVGFVREINKLVKKGIGDGGVYDDSGLQLVIGSILDGNVAGICDALFIANTNCEPRITKKDLETYVDTLEDFDGFVNELRDFFFRNNATSKIMKRLSVAEEQQKVALEKAQQEIEETRELMKTSKKMTKAVTDFRKSK